MFYISFQTHYKSYKVYLANSRNCIQITAALYWNKSDYPNFFFSTGLNSLPICLWIKKACQNYENLPKQLLTLSAFIYMHSSLMLLCFNSFPKCHTEGVCVQKAYRVWKKKRLSNAFINLFFMKAVLCKNQKFLRFF